MTALWAKGLGAIVFVGGVLWMLRGGLGNVLFGLALSAYGVALFAVVRRLGRKPDGSADADERPEPPFRG